MESDFYQVLRAGSVRAVSLDRGRVHALEHGLLQREGAQMKTDLCVSIAIAVYNEEAVLAELLRRTSAVLDQIPGGPHELVVVDDGSSDGTWEILETATLRCAHVKAVGLSRNFG